MDQDNKNAANDAKKSYAGEYTFRFLIPTGIAGGIIGKGGDRVKSLNKKYNAYLTLPDKQQVERVFTIIIDVNKFADCFRDVLDSLTPMQDDELRTKNGSMEIRMLIHSGLASAVIGQGGSRIKEFREKLNAVIKVFSEKLPLSSEQVLTIATQKSNIPTAIQEIAGFLKEQSFRGTTEQYDAMNYDPQLAYNCGSYLVKDGSSYQAPNQYGHPASFQTYGHVRPLAPQHSQAPNLKKPRIAVDPIEEARKAFEKKLRDQGLRPEPSAYAVPPQPQYGYPPRYGASPYVDPYAAHGYYPQPYQRTRAAYHPGTYEHEDEIESPPFEAIEQHVHPKSRNPIRSHPVPLMDQNVAAEEDDDETSAQVTVPNELAASVLGKRNENINQIRELSGAQIDVEPSGRNRLVTISGGFEQVDVAFAQIKESIRNAEASRRHY